MGPSLVRNRARVSLPQQRGQTYIYMCLEGVSGSEKDAYAFAQLISKSLRVLFLPPDLKYFGGHAEQGHDLWVYSLNDEAVTDIWDTLEDWPL